MMTFKDRLSPVWHVETGANRASAERSASLVRPLPLSMDLRQGLVQKANHQGSVLFGMQPGCGAVASVLTENLKLLDRRTRFLKELAGNFRAHSLVEKTG